MVIEDGVDFELSPHEVAALWLVDYRPPKSAFQYALDHYRIIPAANVSPIGDIFRLRLHKNTIGVIDLPQEIEIPKNPFFDLLLRTLLLIEPADEGILFVEEELVDDVIFGVDLSVSAEGSVEAVDPLPSFLFEELAFGLDFGGMLLQVYQLFLFYLALGLGHRYLLLF